MGCGSCGSGGCSSDGCGQKGGCATGGCNKLNTYDWLNNMLPPDRSEVDNVYEVRFKNTRKAFYRNVNGLRLYIGDPVVVESDRGYDVGVLSLGGVMAELQMRKKAVRTQIKDLPRIYRKANDKDLELLKQVREREQETLVRSREIVNRLRLEMKVSDVEYQGDNAKAIFYYIADHRVDFRMLIKELAREFRIRVEMKQIGLRYEAGLLGGIGACGRELCCSTWLTEFKTVSTSAARYQNLSLNPMKISGLCGRLKCCLNYELDAYMDALRDIPQVNHIDTNKGRAFLQKTDIFKGTMWFSYPSESSWYPLQVSQVEQVLELNKKGEKPVVFGEHSAITPTKEVTVVDADIDFVDGVGTTVLKEEKRRRGGKKRTGRNKKGNPRNQGSKQRQGGNPPSQSPPEAKTDGKSDGHSPARGKGGRRRGGRGRSRGGRNRGGGSRNNSSNSNPSDQSS